MRAMEQRRALGQTLGQMVDQLNDSWETFPAVVGVPYKGRYWSAVASHNEDGPPFFGFMEGASCARSAVLPPLHQQQSGRSIRASRPRNER